MDAVDDSAVVDLRIARTIRSVIAAIDVRNALDDRYAPLGFALGDVPYYYPAPGRSVSFNLTFRRESP